MLNYNESEFNKAKGIFSKSLKIQNDVCLCPYDKCKNKTMKCHSIQDNRILISLADDGHVYMIKPDITRMQRDSRASMLRFQRLGIHDATTFTGLCNEHDSEMFRPIDNEDLDLSNSEHAFLLTYRAVLKEAVVLIEETHRTQFRLEEKMNNGLVTADRYDEEMIISTQQILKAYDFMKYKEQFDKMFCNKTYDSLCYRGIVLKERCQFAASTTFSTLEMSTKVDGIERITINVFPYKDCTYILFASLPEDEKYMDTYIAEFLNASGGYQLYILSKIILRNCENIVFSPSLISGWSKSKTSTVLQYVAETCDTDKTGYENKDLYLF